MKKADLKTGMRVRMRNGQIYLVVKDIYSTNYGHQDIAFIGKAGFLTGDTYNDDLFAIESFYKEFDIMEVFTVTKNPNNLLNGQMLNLNERHSIWRRQEYTEEQKEIFKALKLLGFNYVAIDKNSEICAYISKPKKEPKCNYWNVSSYEDFYELTDKNKEAFNFIGWEDEEPFKIPEL